MTFAERGCNKIFLVDISQEGLKRTQELIAQVDAAVTVIKHSADLRDETAVKNMVDTCIREFGRIDFACNNAGIAMSNMLTHDTPMKLFDKVFDVNLKTVSSTQKLLTHTLILSATSRSSFVTSMRSQL